MEINDFKNQIKNGTLSGVYIFAGNEDYLKRYYLGMLRDAVAGDQSLAVFNNPTFDGERVDFGALTDAVKAPPMMADLKLVEWRHADFSLMKDKELLAIEELISLTRVYTYSILAFTAAPGSFDFGTPKRPSKLLTRLGKDAAILRFEQSADNQLYAWLKKHFDSHGVGVSLDTLRALIFQSGHSMDVLASEVEKLAALAKERGRDAVTPADVEEVASSTPECDTFALSNAVTDRNKPRAYYTLEELKIRRTDPAIILGMLARTFDDMLNVAALIDEGRDTKDIATILGINPYKLGIYTTAVKRYGLESLLASVSELARVDAGSKYGGVTGYTAVELFISKTL